MIEETCLQITEIEHRWTVRKRLEGERRTRLRHIDGLLEELEALNLTGETEIPADLRDRVERLTRVRGHPVCERPAEEVSVLEWMDALYDLQDDLMFSTEDDE